MRESRLTPRVAWQEAGAFLRFMVRELKPTGRVFTVFNLITVPIMLLGAGLLVVRFAKGLGSITNLSQNYPWGLWVGFDVITGVAFAGGAYVITFMVYVLRLEKYHAITRVTVLNGLLAYMFYAGALLLDLGRPWNVVNPIIGNSFGVSSVMFLVAWHFMLYMIAEFVEFSPAIAEWLGRRRWAQILSSLTLGATIIGITLSFLHQSGLGALFLMAKGKVHPLWYSEFIPILFLVSSVFAGLSMVIMEGTITRRVFTSRMSPIHVESHRGIVLGLARVCAGAMFVYLFLKLLVLIHGQQLAALGTRWGALYLIEVVGFTAIPCVMFVLAVRRGSLAWCRTAAVLTLLGIILNRLNVSIIAFRWYDPVRYVPSWGEVMVTLAVISAEIWAFRWVVERMPVLTEAPGWMSIVQRPAESLDGLQQKEA
jgi:Ni/Fe-hydrogenase subunit HybB-like protein